MGKVGRVYIAAGEEEYRLLNPPLQEYVTPGWLGKAIAFESFGECDRRPRYGSYTSPSSLLNSDTGSNSLVLFGMVGDRHLMGY
ncbi:MAG: hypothetical protein ACP5D7_25850 [Limnospira sp.]